MLKKKKKIFDASISAIEEGTRPFLLYFPPSALLLLLRSYPPLSHHLSFYMTNKKIKIIDIFFKNKINGYCDLLFRIHMKIVEKKLINFILFF